MNRTLTATLVALALSCPAFGLGDSDWSQWRGPKGNGHSPDTGLLKSWPAGGPPLAWKATGLGSGFSSVSVHGNFIYSMGDIGDDCVLVALNLSDGKVAWTTKIGAAGKIDHPGTRSTPSTDGKFIYAMSELGDLICCDAASGKEVWKKSLENDFGAKQPHWGFAESPLLDGNALLCLPGGSKGAVVALNKETGATLWQSDKLAGGAEYTSLAPADLGGVHQYVAVTKKTVAGISAKDGKVLWQGEHPGGTAVITTPVVHNDIVFVTVAYGVGCRAFQIKATDGTFSAEKLYADEGGKKGGPKIMDNKGGGIIAVGDHFYGVTDGGMLRCIEPKTGKIVWENGCVGAKASLAYADGHLVVRSEVGKGTVALVEATPEAYKEKGRFDQPERSRLNSWAHPVVIGGKLYLRDQDNLFCYDVKEK